MIQELITYEIKNTIIAMGSDYRGFYVYLRPIGIEIDQHFINCCDASFIKLKEIQSTPKGKFRCWKSPCMQNLKYDQAIRRFFKLCKQANLKQIQFQ